MPEPIGTPEPSTQLFRGPVTVPKGNKQLRKSGTNGDYKIVTLEIRR
jgi:hypothetical protein